MSRILVYFRDGQKAGFDRDKVIFQAEDGKVFSMAVNDLQQDCEFGDLVAGGRALVNWASVNYIREIEPLSDAPGVGGETE